MIPLGSVTGSQDRATGSGADAQSAGEDAVGAARALGATPGRTTTSGRVGESALRRPQVETRIASGASPRTRSARRRMGLHFLNLNNSEALTLALATTLVSMISAEIEGIPRRSTSGDQLARPFARSGGDARTTCRA